MSHPIINKLISFVWSNLSQLARILVRWRWLERVKLNCRVISVGNIQVGGAGKTPLVALIANEAHLRGLSVCILSRGYKGALEKTGGCIFPKNSSSSSPQLSSPQLVRASEVGDEAALLHELCPYAYIGVGSNRFAQFQFIQSRASLPIQLVILDDGFQNWRIHKDLEIVALTSSSSDEVIFRDSPSALKYADLLVWTKGNKLPYLKELGAKPLVRVQYQLPKAKNLDPLWLITGIANGRSAYLDAIQSGYIIKRHISFEDHTRYTQNLIESILKESRLSGCKVALTGKDWVKWKEFDVCDSNLVILEPKLNFIDGYKFWLRSIWKE